MTGDDTTSAAAAQPLVAVGRVVKPHGIRGEVSIHVLSDVHGRLEAGSDVLLDGKPRKILSSRPHQGRLLVVFEGVPDRTAAEGLRGALVESAKAELDDEDHFYVHELVGASVVGPDEQPLGEVVDLILLPPAAGYDLLEVEHPDGHRWLLPASDDLVEADEAADGTLVLRVGELPAGLVDQSEADAVPAPEVAAASDAAASDAAASDAAASDASAVDLSATDES